MHFHVHRLSSCLQRCPPAPAESSLDVTAAKLALATVVVEEGTVEPDGTDPHALALDLLRPQVGGAMPFVGVIQGTVGRAAGYSGEGARTSQQ